MRKRLVSLLVCFYLGTIIFAQTNIPREKQIGPNGTDSSKFSKIYVIREKDKLSGYYIGLMLENYYGLVAKINSNNCYQIMTPLKGKQYIYASTNGVKKGVWLDLTESSKHYLILEVSGVTKSINLNFLELDSTTGKSKVENYKGNMNYRFSTIPFDYSGFISDYYWKEDNKEKIMRDSAVTQINEKYSLTYFTPSQLDSYMKVLGVYWKGFYSRTISTTYTEAFEVLDLGKQKIKTEEEFDSWLKIKFPKLLNAKGKRYSDFKIKILSKNDHSMGGFNALLIIELEDKGATTKGVQPHLIMREIYRVVSWKNEKGKLHFITIRLSERGKEEELSKDEDLVKRFEKTDKSIRLKKVK